MEFPSRREVIKQQKKEGKLIAAVFPIHYPRELFKAFGIHPVEVWGPPGVDTTYSRAHLQSYICSVIQSSLAFYLNGGLDSVDMIVIPHCCDSLQGFGSIMRDFIGTEVPVFTPYIPRGRRKEDIEFLSKEIKKLYDALSSIVGYEPTEDELMESIYQEEEIEMVMLEVYDKHVKYMTSTVGFYKMVRTREFMPNELFITVLEEFLKRDFVKRGKVLPLVFSGIIPEPKNVLNIIEESGAVIVDDDFASVKRRIYGKGVSHDPFVRMAERIVNSPPDSMKGSSIRERVDNIKSIVKKRKAKGVVFYDIKFCEPEKFYQPIIRKELERIGIRSLSLEVDINEDIPQQIVTRIKAFIETLYGDE